MIQIDPHLKITRRDPHTLIGKISREYIRDIGPIKDIFKYETPSTWDERYSYELLIFQVINTGEWGIWECIPNGYSSLTYEPDDVLELFPGSKTDFYNLVLTQPQRDLWKWSEEV